MKALGSIKAILTLLALVLSACQSNWETAVNNGQQSRPIGFASTGSKDSASKCQIEIEQCPAFPQFAGTQTDFFGPASSDENTCLNRAQAYYETCGNSSPATATFFTNGGADSSYTAPLSSICRIQVESCPGFPQFEGNHQDFFIQSSSDEATCLQRARPYYETCGSKNPATATFHRNGFPVKSVTFPEQSVWSMGFYAGVDRTPIEDIDWDGISHIAHAAAVILEDGSVNLNLFGEMESDSAPLIAAAHARGKKVILSLGVYDYGNVNSGTNLVNIIQTKGADFAADKIMEVINKYGYDGVDVDWEWKWEWNTARDFPLATKILRSLRQKLGPSRILTFENLGSPEIWAGSEALSYLDRLNVMTYDRIWFAPFTWYNSALFSKSPEAVSIESTLKSYLDAGVPAQKINLGIPFYAWIFKGQGVTGPYQKRPATAPEQAQINYRDIINQYNGVETNPNYHWDDVAQVPWLSLPDGWISFENERSIRAKAEFMKKSGVGGWIIWEIGSDYLPNQSVKHPLLNTLKGYWSVPQ